MQYIIHAPATGISGEIHLPASKSISNRALILTALSGGITQPRNLSDCDDTNVMLQALSLRPDTIDIGAAGTSMRFLTALLAISHEEHTITGSDRMKHRPIGVLVDALRRLGANISYTDKEGFPPLHIRGQQLNGGEMEIPGNVSSQYISALLMIGPKLQQGLTLTLTGDIISRPYIDLTLWMMEQWGARCGWADMRTIQVEPGEYIARDFLVENDWSAASYWYEAVALSPAGTQINLTGLHDGSRQGDSTVRYIFSLLGVKTTFTDNGVHLINTGQHLPRLDYDFSGSPDLTQTLVACCTALGVPFHFRGLQTLTIKETDRIAALTTECQKLGYHLTQPAIGTELAWDGQRGPARPEADIDTYDDHRMALAFAPLALRLGDIRINNPQVVSKSYPEYWEDLRRAGMEIN